MECPRCGEPCYAAPSNDVEIGRIWTCASCGWDETEGLVCSECEQPFEPIKET